MAEAACRMEPQNGAMLNTLGVAQYRVGQLKGALQTLMKSEAVNVKANDSGKSSPTDVAFIAMAQFRLGQADEAWKRLAQLRELMKELGRENKAESQGFLREAEALIEGKASETKKTANADSKAAVPDGANAKK